MARDPHDAGDDATWRFAGTTPGAPGTPTPEAAPRAGRFPPPRLRGAAWLGIAALAVVVLGLLWLAL